jgi:hypothetical protein
MLGFPIYCAVVACWCSPEDVFFMFNALLLYKPLSYLVSNIIIYYYYYFEKWATALPLHQDKCNPIYF